MKSRNSRKTRKTRKSRESLNSRKSRKNRTVTEVSLTVVTRPVVTETELFICLAGIVSLSAGSDK